MRSARRLACARVAWRQAKRAPWRSALAAAMVALPISAMVFASTVISTASTTAEERATAFLGASEISIGDVGEAFDADLLEATLPGGSSVILISESSGATIVGDDEVVYASITELPMQADAVDGMLVLDDGRFAVEPGEAVVHPDVLRVRAARIGDRLAVRGTRVRVVGTAVMPMYVSQPFIAIEPETIQAEPEQYVRGLVDLPAGADIASAVRTVKSARGATDVTTRTAYTSSDVSDAEAKAIATAASFAMTALALGATGLIAAAAFAVGARRQLRVLGLVAAVGGESRDARAVVLLGGSVLGGLGAMVGAALGLAGSAAALPHLTHFSDSLPGPLEINWPALIGAPVLGVLAATTAALMPARTTSRVAPMEALAGRMPAPRPPGRLAWIGLGVFALGFVLTPFSWRATRDSSGLTLGLGALGGGLLLAIPLAVTVVGKLATRLPTTLRLAARDVARHGRRTGAALAATTLALSAAVLAASAARADAEYWRRSSWLTDDQMLLQFGEDGGRAPDGLAALRQALPGVQLGEMRYASPRGSSERSASVFGPAEQVAGGGVAYQTAGPLTIGTPELLRAMHAEAAIDALADNQIIVLGIGAVTNGKVTLQIDGKKRQREPAIEVSMVDLPGDGEMLSRFLISDTGARALGLEPAPAQQVLLALGHPISDEERDRVGEVLASLGAYAYVMTAKDFLPSSVGLRPIALGLSALVSLLIVGAALAMVGAESRRDRAILSAVGAGPFARRRLAAARAFLLTIVAGIVAVPGGFATFAVFQWSRPDGYPVIVPWDGIATAVIGVPLLAALAAYSLSRRPSADAMLRPLA